jgi:hypothetical protein
MNERGHFPEPDDPRKNRLRLPMDFQRRLDDHPQTPFGPQKEARQVRRKETPGQMTPGRSEGRSSGGKDLPRGQDHLQAHNLSGLILVHAA